MVKTKLRQSNLELLRVVSMILILMSHCDEIFGLSDLYSTSLGINKIITDWLHIGGQIGVGCFVLISGYFMVQQNISFRKLLRLEGSVWFYTIGIWIVWVVHNFYQGQFAVEECLTEAVYALFPVLTGHYWFITTYVILMVLSPFLNKLIFALERQQYKAFLATLIIVFVVLKGGIPGVLPKVTEGRMMPVLIMYFIAGYMRRFGKIEKARPVRHFMVAAIVYLMLFATFYGFTYIGKAFDSQGIMDNRYFYRVLNSPFTVLICTELFIGFLGLNIKHSKVINKIAGSTLGVYLLHSNRLMNGYLQKLFPVYKETQPGLIFVYSIISVLVIYVVSTLIDLVRENSIGRLWVKFLDIYFERIHNKLIKTGMKIWGAIIKCVNRFYNS